MISLVEKLANSDDRVAARRELNLYLDRDPIAREVVSGDTTYVTEVEIIKKRFRPGINGLGYVRADEKFDIRTSQVIRSLAGMGHHDLIDEELSTLEIAQNLDRRENMVVNASGIYATLGIPLLPEGASYLQTSSTILGLYLSLSAALALTERWKRRRITESVLEKLNIAAPLSDLFLRDQNWNLLYPAQQPL